MIKDIAERIKYSIEQNKRRRRREQIRQEREQQARLARLHELEHQRGPENRPGVIYIPNPFEELDRRKQIKQLKAEIEAYQHEKETRGLGKSYLSLYAWFLMFLAPFAILAFILPYFEPGKGGQPEQIMTTQAPAPPTPPPPPPPTTAPKPKPQTQAESGGNKGQYAELKKGDQGSSVLKLQCELVSLGFNTNGIDGDYGNGTEAAVRAFQECNGITISGIATSETQAVLFSSSAKNKAKAKPVSYSTNSQEKAKNGNSGIFSYRSTGGQYYIYYIIDFDEGYVYRFLTNESSCDRLKIDSGNLCTRIIFTYHDVDSTWMNGLHFKYNRQPDHLILEDDDHYETDFYTTNLAEALALRSEKRIVDY